MKPDTAQLLKIYTAWRASLEDLSDVEGLYPTFVMNILPSSALSVAKNNGVGNTWGLDDSQSFIRKPTPPPPSIPSPTNIKQSGSSQPAGPPQSMISK